MFGFIPGTERKQRLEVKISDLWKIIPKLEIVKESRPIGRRRLLDLDSMWKFLKRNKWEDLENLIAAYLNDILKIHEDVI